MAPRCSPLEVTLFNPAYNKDKFEMTSLTIDGKLGPLKAVYTAGYLVAARGAGGRLHQLFPRGLRRILSVLRQVRFDADLLLAERSLAHQRAEQALSAGVSLEHSG